MYGVWASPIILIIPSAAPGEHALPHPCAGAVLFQLELEIVLRTMLAALHADG